MSHKRKLLGFFQILWEISSSEQFSSSQAEEFSGMIKFVSKKLRSFLLWEISKELSLMRNFLQKKLRICLLWEILFE